MPLNVAFLWHMHQPYYVDPIRGFHCTFNLTPVLLKQIEELANNQVRDLWHEFGTTPAAALTFAQKCGLLEHLFKANWDNMIKPYPRYWALLQKRGLNLARVSL